MCALLFSLFTTAVFAAEKKDGISISFDSDDARTRFVERHALRDARLAVTTKSGAAVLLLLNDAVAVQLSDATLAAVTTKEDAGFLEGLLVAGVQFAVRKSVEYPIANLRSAEIRGGNLVLTNDEGKPVFDNVKVNGDNVTRNISAADAQRFVTAFRAIKARR